ncbi:ABC transporter permease [Clostridium botulinum]|nr:ABC transporter permease [Clostridium botulinum]
MNFLKRAMLSISKKKIKSLILFVVLLIIANMVLVGLSIQTATKKSTQLAREKLGSDVTLKINEQKFMEERRNNKEAASTSRPSLTTDIADALKDNEHVISYNYISSGFGLAENFENVKNDDSDEDTNSNEGEGKPRGMFGMGGSNVTTMPEVSFSGTMATNLLSDFKDGDSKIIEGRGITKNDLGKNVVVIEKNLAKENSLKVGSKIQVASVDENTTLELEVVGIYEANTDTNTNDNRNMDFLNPYNNIYMPYNVASKISASDDASSKNITSAVYFMDNPDNIDSFKEYAKNKKIDLQTYTLDANDLLYKQMVGPIENVGSFSKTLVVTVSVAGAMILVLIIALSLKDRKYEIGVLLSLGENKFKVISQLIVEVFLVASIAFAASAFTGNLAANKIGDSLLANEIKVTESSSVQGNPNFGGRGHMAAGGFDRNNSKDIKNADVVKDMDVSVTTKDLEKLAVIGLLIVIASAAIPTISVLRFSPKTILSKRE